MVRKYAKLDSDSDVENAGFQRNKRAGLHPTAGLTLTCFSFLVDVFHSRPLYHLPHDGPTITSAVNTGEFKINFPVLEYLFQARSLARAFSSSWNGF